MPTLKRRPSSWKRFCDARNYDSGEIRLVRFRPTLPLFHSSSYGRFVSRRIHQMATIVPGIPKMAATHTSIVIMEPTT